MFVHGIKRVGGLKKGSFFSFELKKAGDQTTFVTQFLKTNSNEEVQLSQQPRRSSPLPNSSGTEKQTSRSEGGGLSRFPLYSCGRDTKKKPLAVLLSIFVILQAGRVPVWRTAGENKPVAGINRARRLLYMPVDASQSPSTRCNKSSRWLYNPRDEYFWK